MHDIKSNIHIQESHSANSYNTGAQNGTALDLSKYESASFFISLGSVGSAGTLNATLQMSDDNSTFINEDGSTENDTAITQLTAAGTAQLNVVRPQKQYYRVVATVGVNTVYFGAIAVAGPPRHVPA